MSDISIALLQYLKDAEIHTITSSTLSLQHHFNLTPEEKTDFDPKRRSKKKEHVNLSSTKFYKKVIDAVYVLRKAKLLKDFPKTKDEGIFSITDDGLALLSKNRTEIKKIINSKFLEYKKRKKS